MAALLAVDLGLKTGLALFGEDGRVRWYRSQHFGNSGALKRAAQHLLRDSPDLAWIFLEGGGTLADVWQHQAQRQNVATRLVAAETWRQALLYPREQRCGRDAKQRAAELARRVIAWSAAPRPTALRHDTAEAILLGLWGVIDVGWLPAVPAELRR